MENTELEEEAEKSPEDGAAANDDKNQKTSVNEGEVFLNKDVRIRYREPLTIFR